MALFIPLENSGLFEKGKEVIMAITEECPIIEYNGSFYISLNEEFGYNEITIADSETSAKSFLVFSSYEAMQDHVRDIKEEMFETGAEVYFSNEVIKSWAKGEFNGPGSIYGTNFYDWLNNICDDESAVIEEISCGEGDSIERIVMNDAGVSEFSLSPSSEMVSNDFRESDEGGLFSDYDDVPIVLAVCNEESSTYQLKESFRDTATKLKSIILEKTLECEGVIEGERSIQQSPASLRI